MNGRALVSLHRILVHHNRLSCLSVTMSKKRSRSSSQTSIPVATTNEELKPGSPVFKYDNPVSGKLLKRYKRFLGDVAFEDDQDHIVIHVPNTGPMTGLLDNLPAPIYCSKSDNPSRKYAHTLEWIQPSPDAAWVGVHSAKANAMAFSLLESKALTNVFGDYTAIKKEVKYGKEGSRVDFVLENDDNKNSSQCYVEVKSVTLAEKTDNNTTIALFPDTVSDRAQRHVRELIHLAKSGTCAALLFIIQRGDCSSFAPCHEKDPGYGRLVIEAEKVGVKIVAVVCDLDVDNGCVVYKGQVPVNVEYKNNNTAL